MKIVEFLLARIEEDERYLDVPIMHPTGECDECDRARIFAAAPERWAAEFEAKRRIIALWTDLHTVRDGYPADDCDPDAPPYDPHAIDEIHTGLDSALRDVFRRMAVVWVEHPDYRQEWRP